MTLLALYHFPKSPPLNVVIDCFSLYTTSMGLCGLNFYLRTERGQTTPEHLDYREDRDGNMEMIKSLGTRSQEGSGNCCVV